MQVQRIKSIKNLGIQNTLDFKVNHEDHNFYVEGMVTSNSHSASVAYMGALTVYLKYKYPLQFFTACLNVANELPDTIDEISKIQSELQYFNIKLLPPHILKSDIKFTIEGNDIRFSISNIKGISEKSIEKLQKFRHQHSNKFEIFKAADESEVPINVLGALIMSGSMDDVLTQTRPKTMLETVLWNLLTDKEKIKVLEIGATYNFDLINIVKALNTVVKNDKGKVIIKDSRLDTIRKKYTPYIQIYNFNNKNQELATYIFEKALLSFSYSTNLHKIYSKVTNDLRIIKDVNDELPETRVRFVGEVKEVKMGKSKEKQTPYMKLTIGDHSGSITVLMFNAGRTNRIDECEYNNGRLPKEDDIVICSGTKKGDAVFAEIIGVQDFTVLKKVSELKDKKVEENKEMVVE